MLNVSHIIASLKHLLSNGMHDSKHVCVLNLLMVDILNTHTVYVYV